MAVCSISRRLTDYEIKLIGDLYRSGKNCVLIARQLGCNESVIHKLLQGTSYGGRGKVRMGRHANGKLTTDQVRRIVDLFRDGKTIKEIVDETKVPRYSVTDIVHGKSYTNITGGAIDAVGKPRTIRYAPDRRQHVVVAPETKAEEPRPPKLCECGSQLDCDNRKCSWCERDDEAVVLYELENGDTKTSYGVWSLCCKCLLTLTERDDLLITRVPIARVK